MTGNRGLITFTGGAATLDKMGFTQPTVTVDMTQIVAVEAGAYISEWDDYQTRLIFQGSTRYDLPLIRYKVFLDMWQGERILRDGKA